MKISVAMCTYNGQAYLEQQLESLLRQVRQPHEVVICDDGSTDDTPGILENFQQKAPFAVRLIRNAVNVGSTRNFAQAISLCEGELIALSDQDDVWRVEKLSVLAKIFERDPSVDAAFSDGELIDENSQPVGCSLWRSAGYTQLMQELVDKGEPLTILRSTYFVTGATLMFRSSSKEMIGGIPPSWVHDAWIAWRLAIYGRLLGVPKQLIQYRVHAANQVGVNTLPFFQLLQRRELPKVRVGLSKESARLELLQDSIRGSSELSDAELAALHVLEGRRSFLQKRAAVLTRSRVVRPLHALALLGEYGSYSKGWRSLLADLVL